jgi:hypothetical protein
MNPLARKPAVTRRTLLKLRLPNSMPPGRQERLKQLRQQPQQFTTALK